MDVASRISNMTTVQSDPEVIRTFLLLLLLLDDLHHFNQLLDYCSEFDWPVQPAFNMRLNTWMISNCNMRSARGRFRPGITPH